MEKFRLVIEVLKLLMRANAPLSTAELHRELYAGGVLGRPGDRVERRRLLRALNTLVELGYVEEIEEGRRKKWRLNPGKFKFLSGFTRDELISLIVLFSFLPGHYRELPFFSRAYETIARFEKELSPEERELLRFSFERIPNLTERWVYLEPELLKKVIGAILDNRGAYLGYRGRSYRVFPVKLFTYNGLFYVGALTDKGYRNFLLSRIEFFEPLNDEISLEEKKKRVCETFEIPDEEPFLFGALFPHDYATDREIRRGIKFSPYQFFIDRVGEGILVYTVGFTGKRFASWFLAESVVELYGPSEEMIALARKAGIKELVPRISYQLQVNLKRFKKFKEKMLQLLEGRLKVFREN